MQNPFKEIASCFEVWMCVVFGIYSQDFYEWHETYFSVPDEYVQQELQSLFWFYLNNDWHFMQPDLMRLQKENEEWVT